jgi:enoyl-CoA hydratase/carnithine racemase
MSDPKITVETRGHVLLMGFNRPAKRNALDLEMFAQLSRAYGQLEADPDLRVGLLFAHGDHFTSGLELDQWAPVMAGGDFSTILQGGIDPFGVNPPYRSKPIVIALQGYALTVGTELALASDIRVAAENAIFGQIEIKRGIYPVGGATIRLPREIGWGNAMRYLLTGETFGAAEAYRLGMIQEVTPVGEAFARALAIAQTIAEQAPLGVYASLASSWAALQDEEAEKARLFPRLKPILASEDAAEGVMSFLERRTAQFKGR